uniref:nucleotidyltransferase domain-containing protein n=1 Tax=Roseburia sp. TaxID=2049040 RepID=UPI003FF07B65
MGKMGNTKGSGMPVSISNILREYVNGIKNIFGRDYEKTILYGSYARGDNRLDSDIDIMILVKCDDDMIHEHMRAVRDYNLAKGRLQQVRDDLKSAQLNFSAGLLKAANNRAYYAIFYAVAAVK